MADKKQATELLFLDNKKVPKLDCRPLGQEDPLKKKMATQFISFSISDGKQGSSRKITTVGRVE